jgi:hypothetical protein
MTMLLALSGTSANVVIDIVYSLIGFIIGWIFGRIGRDVAKENPKPRWYPSVRNGLGILILIMSTYTMISGVVSAHHDRQVSTCQSQLNSAFREALIQRADAANLERASATQERANQKKLLLIELDTVATLPQRQQAVRDYIESLDAADQALDSADKQRTDAPLPDTLGCE